MCILYYFVDFEFYLCMKNALSALTMLVWHQEEQPASKNE